MGSEEGVEVKDPYQVELAVSALDVRCPPAGSRWMHVRAGGTYTVVAGVVVEATVTPAVAYRSDQTEVTWVRPLDEFLDGRFVPLPPESP